MPHHPHQQQQTTTIAIVGTDALAEDILARLLEREGYDTKVYEAHPTKLTEGALDGVDVVLFAPGLDSEVLFMASLEAMKSTPKTAATPVLSLSAALQQALLDELSTSLSWQDLFEELVCDIKAGLGAVSAKALGLDAGETA